MKLTEKLKTYLQDKVDEVLPKYQEEYRSVLHALGFNSAINGSFVEFMSVYCDEHYDILGLIHDIMNDDLSDIENGVSKQLWNNNVPKKYISL